tara:strand:+ start:301 stop:828 length:528 start_codon:yes stop_codon:yes gene_type:complete
MHNFVNKDLLSSRYKLTNVLDENFENIQEFVNTSNARLDAIISITNNSHAIAADAVTAMICENQDSVNSHNCVNTTNKMSVCLRDGEIIIRYITFLLITKDESILEKSCLRDLKNAYIALGVPLSHAIRVVELIKDSTIIDIKTTSSLSQENKSIIYELIKETEMYFEKIITLLD